MVLGGLGALLGGSWGGLGRSCGDLGSAFGAVKFLIDFLIDFGRQKGAQREAFWHQNGAKIDAKTRSKLKSEKVAFQNRLGLILRRFGARPGRIFIDF